MACCRRRAKVLSRDYDEHQKVMTYSGLETYILNSSLYDESGADGCTTIDSPDEDTSSFSSSKDAFISSSPSSSCLMSSKQEEEHMLHEWEALHNFNRLCTKGKSPAACTMHISDVENMKERFGKLLLGDDVSGGARGISTALALSNAITNLSATVFGELWKLEPLSEEKKSRWCREMEWLLSPTNYMVELVPAKQNGENGSMLEIMTPKARSDVQTNLPALRKLDSMLIEVLDSMVDTEFWYAEGGSRGEGQTVSSGIRQTKKWWLPSPRVPEPGLSNSQRKKLGFQGKFVHQVLKAAKSINEHVLLQIPIPVVLIDALPKTGRQSLGEDIYQAITTENTSIEKTLVSLNLKNEHSVLDTMNRLEGAIYAWKRRISEETKKRASARQPWYFSRDNGSEVGKIKAGLDRAQTLLQILKKRFPNLPQSFIDATKVQYNKDVGHSIIEAYSRVLVSLAFSILSRIGDILQEDGLKNPTTPIATLKFDFSSDVYLAGITETPPGNIKRSLIDQMNEADGRLCNSRPSKDSEEECFLDSKARTIMVVAASPYRSRAWCYSREPCISNPYSSSPGP